MTAESLEGKTVALLLMGTTEAGEDDWWVLHGSFHFVNEQLFVKRASGPPFPIDTEWLTKLSPTSETQAEILGPADFVLPLTVGPIPEGEDRERLLFTGLTLK